MSTKYAIWQENCGSWVVARKPDSRKPVREYQVVVYRDTREQAREFVRTLKGQGELAACFIAWLKTNPVT